MSLCINVGVNKVIIIIIIVVAIGSMKYFVSNAIFVNNQEKRLINVFAN